MNKFILLLLLIFVQSKKFNTFQEFNFRNLEVTEEQKEELRNNKQLKEIIDVFYELFNKPYDCKAFSAALDTHLETVIPILTEILPNTQMYFDMIEDIPNDALACGIKPNYDTISTLYKDGIDALYKKEEVKVEIDLITFGITVYADIIKCHYSKKIKC